jgi:pimeloyl-ACP methyl ester carboxylesterase
MNVPLAGAGGAAGVPLKRRRLRSWLRRTLAGVAGLTVLLAAAALLVTYVWRPPEDRGHRSPSLAQITSRYVDTPVARFHYTRTGHGPPVVLLPGGTLWIYSYREVIPELAKRFTVVAVDLPGQGYTTLERHDFGYDLEAMSGALGSFLDAVGLPRASVVGHSWDGAVALYFAERHPERVSRLVLIDSPGLDDPSSWDFRPLQFPVVGEVIGKLMSKSTFEATLRKGFAHPERLTRQAVEEYWAPLSLRQNRRAMWMLQRNLHYSLTDRRLGDVRAPTLVLWGDQDRFDEPWQASELGRRIPRATVRILPGCGHMAHEDCPAQATPQLASFLTGRTDAGHLDADHNPRRKS